MFDSCRPNGLMGCDRSVAALIPASLPGARFANAGVQNSVMRSATATRHMGDGGRRAVERILFARRD